MSSDTGDELGRSITKAFRFLSRIFQDTFQMLAALDGLMADRRWQPTEKTRISWALSNGMRPNRWLLDYLFRWYVPTESDLNNIQLLIAFFIRFDPPENFDQPVVLGTVARFPAAPKYKGLKKQWRKHWRDFDAVVEGLGEKPGPRLLSPQEVSRLLPTTNHVVGTVVPLSSLRGTEAILSLCVDPILGTLPTPGN